MSKSSTSSPPEVSYVVIAYNEASAIVSCLSAITSQEGGSSREIIVVDDCSVDRTAELVLEFATNRPDIVLIRHETNLGRGAARSTGVAAARADLIAMVDADIILPTNWLDRCRRALLDREVDAVGGIAVPDGDVAYVHRKFSLTPKVTSMATEITGSNGLYRRRVFDLVSIDPSLAEGEDVALNFAMREAGIQCASISDLLVEHCESKDFLHSIKWLYQSGKGATRQLATYGKIRTPDIAAAGMIGVTVLSLVARRRGAHWRLVLGLPVIFLLGISGMHMFRKFVIRDSTAKWALASVVNAALLSGYFAGRIAGLPLAVHSPASAGQAIPTQSISKVDQSIE
jgi:glycosyltransferase involved in cell wall biosynthesis